MIGSLLCNIYESELCLQKLKGGNIPALIIVILYHRNKRLDLQTQINHDLRITEDGSFPANQKGAENTNTIFV